MSFRDESQSTSLRVAAAADLNTWSQSDWSDGVQVDALAPLERLLVRTRNTTYEMTVIAPDAGEIVVQGGRFFPLPARASLAGASLGGSFLKLRGIYLGFAMEFWCDGERIVTSPVVSIEPLETTRT